MFCLHSALGKLLVYTITLGVVFISLLLWIILMQLILLLPRPVSSPLLGLEFSDLLSAACILLLPFFTIIFILCNIVVLTIVKAIT